MEGSMPGTAPAHEAWDLCSCPCEPTHMPPYSAFNCSTDVPLRRAS